MWKIVVLAIIVIIVLGWESYGNRKPNPKQMEKRRQETKRQFVNLTEDVTTLFDQYSQTENPSAEETKVVWEKCQSLIEAFEIRYEQYIRFVYSRVCNYWTQKIYASMKDRYDSDELAALSNAFVDNMLDCCYRAAFTYDLTPDDQEALILYLRSLWGIHDPRFLALFEEGCRKNSPLAMRHLADCYYKKHCVELKDYDKAFSLYQQAAQLGDMQAVYMLGQCYENSRGTKTNYQKAGDCYQYAYNMSKSQDCAKALSRLYDGHRWNKNKYSPDIFDCDMPVMKKDNLETLKLDVEKCMHLDLEKADPSIIAASVGLVLEQVVNSFVECYENAYLNDSLAEKIKLLQNKGYFTKEITYQATTVRLLRNRGLHNNTGEPITVDEMKSAVRYIKEIVEYYEQY